MYSQAQKNKKYTLSIRKAERAQRQSSNCSIIPPTGGGWG